MMTIIFIVVGLILGMMLGIALFGMMAATTNSPLDRWQV